MTVRQVLRRRDEGFTFVELLISIALLGAITLAVGGALWFGFRSTRNTYDHLEQSMASMTVVRRLSSDLYAAEGQETVNKCGTGALQIRMRSSATASSYDTIVGWSLSNGAVVRQSCGAIVDGPRTITDKVSTFTPTWNGDGSITVVINGPSYDAPLTLKITPTKVREG